MVHLQPGAAQNKIVSFTDGVLRVRIGAPAHQGRANRALVAFLADILDMPKSDISIANGATGRHKRLLLRGLAEEQLQGKLAKLV